MTALLDFLAAAVARTTDPEERDEIFRLRRMNIKALHLVDRGANKRKILIAKNEEGTEMQTQDMIPGVDANPTAQGVAISKAEELPADVAKAVAGIIDDASVRLASLKKRCEGSTKIEKGGLSPAFIGELGNIQQIIASAGEKFPSIQKADGDPPPDGGAADDDPDAMAKKNGEMKKSDGAPAADPAPAASAPPIPASPAVPSDPFTSLAANIDSVIGIQKAGKAMSGQNWDLLSKAVDLLGQLTNNLSPADKAKAEEKIAQVSKSLAVPAAPAAIPDGMSSPGEMPVAQPKPEKGWASGEDINSAE